MKIKKLCLVSLVFCLFINVSACSDKNNVKSTNDEKIEKQDVSTIQTEEEEIPNTNVEYDFE